MKTYSAKKNTYLLVAGTIVIITNNKVWKKIMFLQDNTLTTVKNIYCRYLVITEIAKGKRKKRKNSNTHGNSRPAYFLHNCMKKPSL